ncbi:FHA domain-containing protein [bacterium]|nr:MAG: FHA domain-containing protein [bacterium]
MKTCLTCGALVADNADVCPDCGMELDSAPSSAAVTPAPAAASVPVVGTGSGFTVDFGFDDAPKPVTPVDGIPPADDFEFGNTVVIDPPSLEKQPAPAPAPLSPVQQAQITLKRAGALTTDSFAFGPGSIVGRFDPDSGPVDVDLAPLPESSYVSRHHVEFRFDAGNDGWFVKDLGSRNGTFWRAGSQGAFSRLTGEQQIQTGDEIALGNARFEFRSL